MGALAIRDLREIDGEPRVQDICLGERLGLAQPVNIRKIIRGRLGELNRYGEVFSATEKTSRLGGRPGTAFHLNEPQALLVCMFSETSAAADVREQIVKVFMAWRHGQLARVAPDPLAPVAPRADILSKATQFEAEYRGGAEFALMIAHLPPRGRVRRMPNFWGDIEVRQAVVKAHRQMTIRELRGALADRYGPHRTPSKSAVHRTWMWLDAIWAGAQARLTAEAS